MTGTCFVPDCNSGSQSARRQYMKEKKKPPKLFSSPRSWTMLQIWSHVIPKTDKSFGGSNKICELHFTEDYVSKFHELTLQDGTLFKLERHYATLKPGAIPTVFSNLPQYSENLKNIIDEMREEFPLHIPEMDIKIDERMENYFEKIKEIQRMSISDSEIAIHEAEKSQSNIKNRNLNLITMNADEVNFSSNDFDLNSKNTDNLSDFDKFVHDSIDMEIDSKVSVYGENETEEENDSELEDITFDVLVQNLKSVPKPNSSWSVTSHGKFVMCAKWNKEYHPEKKVVIDSDLNARVFLNDNEIAAYKNLCITEISDISNILCILDK